ncbi:MAG TPA: hypothetical protein VK845_02260 [Gemmatimonadales bacterium]|nr:hypothetical protein [Gemmatimonadales bacterium]
MSLSSWLANGWLVAHEASPEEIDDLLAIVDRDLTDAAIEALSPDWRLGIAYNAALQLATLALAAEGFRPGRQRGHEYALRSLAYTIEAESALVDVLDGVRRKRNLSHYERTGTTSSGEALEIYTLAAQLRARVVSWLQDSHPDLYQA